MKVLHFVSDARLSWQKTFANFVIGLTKAGIDNIIVMPDEGYTYDFLKSCNTEGLAGKPAFKLIPIKFGGFFDVASCIRLAMTIKQNKVDVVHTQLSRAAMYAGFIKRFVNVKVVSSAQKISAVKYFVNSDFVVACSDSVKNALLENGFSGKISRIYNGIDFEYYFSRKISKKAAKGRLGVDNDTLCIGIVARLSAMKGHGILFEAFKRLTDEINIPILLVVVGDGELSEELKELSQRLSIYDKLLFLGRRDDLVELLSGFDLYVSSSIEKEGLPTILIEALLMKVPVIATDVAGSGEIVLNNKTGFLVKPDAESLYLAMKDFLVKYIREKSSFDNIVENGFRHVLNNFSIENMVNSYIEVYKEVCFG